MGEKQNEPFQLSFNASLKAAFQGSRVTSDGGLIVIRELDERLGLGYLIAEHLSDARRGKNTQLPLADLGNELNCCFARRFLFLRRQIELQVVAWRPPW